MGDDVQTSNSGAVKSVTSELVRAYRAIDKIDRWSGGGQTLALVVKIFGWVGLLCVLWAGLEAQRGREEPRSGSQWHRPARNATRGIAGVAGGAGGAAS